MMAMDVGYCLVVQRPDDPFCDTRISFGVCHVVDCRFAMCAMVMDFAASNPTNLFEKIVAIVLCICMGCVYGYMIGATTHAHAPPCSIFLLGRVRSAHSTVTHRVGVPRRSSDHQMMTMTHACVWSSHWTLLSYPILSSPLPSPPLLRHRLLGRVDDGSRDERVQHDDGPPQPVRRHDDVTPPRGVMSLLRHARDTTDGLAGLLHPSPRAPMRIASRHVCRRKPRHTLQTACRYNPR